MPTYIIEHLDTELYKWSFLEYKHISEIVGKKNLLFTNIKNPDEQKKLKRIGKVEMKSLKEITFRKTCILDPDASKTLEPKDKKEFDYLIFGGILGNDPPEQRTQKAFTGMQSERRNLGNKQMSTNTAVYVAKKIMDGKPFSAFEFIDELVIPIDNGEEIILPFRFVVENGKPILAKGYVEFVKKYDVF